MKSAVLSDRDFQRYMLTNSKISKLESLYITKQSSNYDSSISKIKSKTAKLVSQASLFFILIRFDIYGEL